MSDKREKLIAQVVKRGLMGEEQAEEMSTVDLWCLVQPTDIMFDEEEIEEFSLEDCSTKEGQYWKLYFGRSNLRHGLWLCSLSDFDKNGDKTRKSILNSLNREVMNRMDESRFRDVMLFPDDPKYAMARHAWAVCCREKNKEIAELKEKVLELLEESDGSSEDICTYDI